eukprot:4018351-Prymnesium_polylepis.1
MTGVRGGPPLSRSHQPHSPGGGSRDGCGTDISASVVASRSDVCAPAICVAGYCQTADLCSPKPSPGRRSPR